MSSLGLPDRRQRGDVHLEGLEGTGTVCGTVTLDGNPAPDATVVLSDNPFPAVTAADGTFTFAGTNAGTHSLKATLFVGDVASGELLSAKMDLTSVTGDNPCVTLALERPNLDFRRVFVDSTLHVFDEGDETSDTASSTEFFVGLGQPPETQNLLSTCAGDESRVEVKATVTYVEKGAVIFELNEDLFEGTCFLCNACNNNDHDGSVTSKLVICDASTSADDCAAIAAPLGITASFVGSTTLTKVRVDNTDEHSGEFGEVTLTISNFRQR